MAGFVLRESLKHYFNLALYYGYICTVLDSLMSHQYQYFYSKGTLFHFACEVLLDLFFQTIYQNILAVVVNIVVLGITNLFRNFVGRLLDYYEFCDCDIKTEVCFVCFI